MIKVGINGFGRIGRLAFRSAMERDTIQIVAINDLLDIDYLVYLLVHDSVHGKFDGEVEIKGDHLIVNGQKIRVTSEKDPKNLKWDEVEVDYVIESTGLFLTQEAAGGHIKGGAKKVIISAPSKDAKMFVMGVNHNELRKDDVIFSNASCTTNCLAPIAKIVHDKFGISEGMMTTVHAATAGQGTVDAPNNKDRRRGRSVLNNIIPTTTGATKAVAKVIPSLEGKLTGMSIRVPVADVSLVDFTFRTEKSTSLNEILGTLKEASKNELKGILGYTEEAVVSQDFVSEARSSVIDSKASLELNENFFKIISWYDNEFGYAVKIVDLLEYSASL